ncbi:MAG: RecQ family ATP-dependent DNA helicase, partial [Aeromonas sp.]
PVRCGHCSVCRGAAAQLPTLPALVMPNAAGIRAWCDPLIAHVGHVEARVLTRFLCGISSPLTSKGQARSLAGSGQLAAHPFAAVLAAVQQAYP